MNTIISLVVLVAILPSYSCSLSTPHILLVLVDDLGWSDIGYNNITNIRTPNIDKLATEGVILNNYYVQPVCSPTRSALMTGRYPIHTGMQHEVIKPDTPYGLPLNLQLLPQKMKEAGYSTHIVGKWHLGCFEWEYTPTYRGFDTFYGMYNGAADHWTHKRDGILDFRDGTAPVTDQDGIYSNHAFVKRAEEVIASHNTSAPLFLYLPFQSVHSPTQAPERFVDEYKNIRDKIRRTYAGMVSAVDEAVGNVTNAMKKKGLWDNTLVVFSSDNGGIPLYGGYNWPLRGCKASLWEGVVRATAFVHGNMIEKKGRRSDELMHVTDWFPTLTSLAGLESDSTLDGVNIWDTISRGAPSPRTEIVLNMDLNSAQGMAVRVQHMKLLVNVTYVPWFIPPEFNDTLTPDFKKPNYNRTKLGVALFNITADPEERHDLSTEFPDVVARLMDRIEFYKKGVVPRGNKLPDPEAKEAAMRQGAWGPWQPRREGASLLYSNNIPRETSLPV